MKTVTKASTRRAARAEFGLSLNDLDDITLAHEHIRGKLAMVAECFPDTVGDVHFRSDVALGLKRVLLDCAEDIQKAEQAMRRARSMEQAETGGAR